MAKRNGESKWQTERSMKKEELGPRPPANREAYIDYALDMVLHNLISSGQLDPSKSYLLKTTEMKAHIGRMCDRVRKEQEEGPQRGPFHISSAQHPLRTRWALHPNSLPITIITDKDPFKVKANKARSKPLSSYGKAGGPNSKNKDKSLTPSKSNNVEESSPLPHRPHPPTLHHFHPTADKGRNLTEPVTDRLADGALPMTNVPSTKTANKEDSMRLEPLKAPPQAFIAKLDMRGFNNEEISLDMAGRRLTITGLRDKRDGLNVRKATETIDIPNGINVDNLKIARRLDGILVIEETLPDPGTIL